MAAGAAAAAWTLVLGLTVALDAGRLVDRWLILDAPELPCPRVALAGPAAAAPVFVPAVSGEEPESVSAHAVEHPTTMPVPIPIATASPPTRPTNCEAATSVSFPGT
jgi:hypothetical protein